MLAERGSASVKLVSYECLVGLRPKGSKPPLFLVCWEGGKLIGYRDLIERLPKDLPVYGLRTPPFDGRSHVYPTLEELAGHFLSEVRRFCPEPPYLFAGYCFGGTLAHEMASQLEADGQTAAFVGLIESSPYGHAQFKGPAQRLKRIERERTFVKMLANSGPRRMAALIATRFFGRGSRGGRKLRRVAHRTVRRTGWAWPHRLGNLELVEIGRALDRYVTPSSNVHITLINASRPPHDSEEQTGWSSSGCARMEDHRASRRATWERLAGQVEVLPITATGIGHVSIMREPYVKQLAEQLGQRLDAALQRSEPGGVRRGSAISDVFSAPREPLPQSQALA